jgi:hypothetical protein
MQNKSMTLHTSLKRQLIRNKQRKQIKTMRTRADSTELSATMEANPETYSRVHTKHYSQNMQSLIV